MRVTIIDKRSGQARELDERSALILVALGKAYFQAEIISEQPGRAVVDVHLSHAYETRHMEAAPAKRRGRPPKNKDQ